VSGPSEGRPLLLRTGAHGAEVRDLQRRLTGAGYPAGASGAYDDETELAVRSFQRDRGLHEDGICGPQTWDALVEAGYQLGDRLLYHRRPMLRGDDVAELQRRLCALGFDTGRADGIFGPDTEQAVRDFQRNAALTNDGVCGRDTLAAFARLGDRTDGQATVAELRQTEELRARAAQPGGVVALGHAGELDALVHAVARVLRAAEAQVLVLDLPDEHEQAARANAGGVDAYLGLAVGDEVGAELAYFATPDYTSVGGERLALQIEEHLAELAWHPVAVRGMRLPVLRETRMPAVRCTLGPAPQVVAQLDELATAFGRAITAWLGSPVAPPAEG
jgi:N-acetylmuramoyl-L-alanine amidase